LAVFNASLMAAFSGALNGKIGAPAGLAGQPSIVTASFRGAGKFWGIFMARDMGSN
jgi:hypothetical protein